MKAPKTPDDPHSLTLRRFVHNVLVVTNASRLGFQRMVHDDRLIPLGSMNEREVGAPPRPAASLILSTQSRNWRTQNSRADALLIQATDASHTSEAPSEWFADVRTTVANAMSFPGAAGADEGQPSYAAEQVGDGVPIQLWVLRAPAASFVADMGGRERVRVKHRQ